MIRYALACDTGHEFESWFGSADAFDALKARGLVECPACGSASVEKRIMAPSIGRTRKAGATPVESEPTPAPSPPATEAPTPPQPVALLSEREQAVRAMLRAVRRHVVQNADNVGRSFPDEARRMHYGEIEHRSIYGEANPSEAQALVEEGIEIQALPVVPDDRN